MTLWVSAVLTKVAFSSSILGLALPLSLRGDQIWKVIFPVSSFHWEWCHMEFGTPSLCSPDAFPTRLHPTLSPRKQICMHYVTSPSRLLLPVGFGQWGLYRRSSGRVRVRLADSCQGELLYNSFGFGSCSLSLLASHLAVCSVKSKIKVRSLGLSVDDHVACWTQEDQKCHILLVT